MFADKFARIRSSTNSLRKLLTFKRNDSVDSTLYTDVPKPDSPIYETIDENIVKAPYEIRKKPLTKPGRKINKDDIQIANNADFKLKPPVKPKPNVNNLSKENKPNVVVVKGLASTTNEMVTNNQNRLFNIRNSGLYNNVNGQKVFGFKK